MVEKVRGRIMEGPVWRFVEQDVSEGSELDLNSSHLSVRLLNCELNTSENDMKCWEIGTFIAWQLCYPL